MIIIHLTNSDKACLHHNDIQNGELSHRYDTYNILITTLIIGEIQHKSNIILAKAYIQ